MSEILNSDAATVVESAESSEMEYALPPVLLPGNGVSITDTAMKLAEVYQNADAELRLYNRGNVVFGVSRDNNGAMLSLLSAQRACSEFERVATLLKRDNRGGVVPAICSPATAKTIISSSAFLNSLPKINLVTNSPVILKNEDKTCRVINTYDAASGILSTGKPVETVGLDEAVRMLNNLLADFHFQGGGDKSRALAALLTPALVSGKVLDARAPIMMLQADKSQSGKGFFTKLLGAVYNELPSTVAQRNGGVGSIDESFDTALTLGRPVIVLDNLRGKLNSPQMEAFMTADIYSARVPYSEPAVIDPKRYFIMATSNNFELTQDMANRSCIIRIFKQSRTYRYRTFPEGNILRHIRANQPKYLGAVFAVVEEWVRQGCPAMPDSSHDFREWCSALDWIVRNILHEAPLMTGHREAQLSTQCSEIGWLQNVWKCISDVGSAKEELTAYQVAQCCDCGDMELPGACGIPLNKLDDNGIKQVSSQIGRRFTKLFNDLGEDNEIQLTDFALTRESKKMRYPSGKTEMAIVYCFSPAA